MLYTVIGQRRQVVAIDAATGETRWTFREPDTTRYLRSPRTDFGKGVAYSEGGRPRRASSSRRPAFFLWALDAKTGRPLENWGTHGAAHGFPAQRRRRHDPRPHERLGTVAHVEEARTTIPITALPRKLGEITCLVAADRGQRRDRRAGRPRAELRPDPHRERPADIQGYDAKTGKRLWKFHVIPRPGELGNDTWENDSWVFSGKHRVVGACIRRPAARARLSSSPTRRPISSTRAIARATTCTGGSILALDVKTGKRKWHFQVHHSEQWNYDIPTAPILMDLTVNGQKDPGAHSEHQAGTDLRVQPRDRRADLADRRAPGDADGSARQLHVADAAVSDRA